MGLRAYSFAFYQLTIYRNLAVSAGELDCVWQKVEQHLLKPPHVRVDQRGVVIEIFEIRIYLDLLCLSLVYLNWNDLVHSLLKGELMDVHLELVQLDLSEVQNVIYEKPKQLRGWVLSLAVELSLFHELFEVMSQHARFLTILLFLPELYDWIDFFNFGLQVFGQIDDRV